MFKTDDIKVVVKIELTFWNAIKMRIAGKGANHFLESIKRQLQLLADTSVVETLDRMNKGSDEQN